MQFVSNIIFWLQAAFASALTACCVAIILFIICVVGIGWGVGRLWHAKWKIGVPGTIVSVVFGLLVAALGVVYVAMGFVKETMIAAPAKIQLIDGLTKGMSDNSKLLNYAFKSGLKSLVASGTGVEAIDPETTMEFTIPGETDAEIRNHQELFISGVVKAIALGDTSKNAKKTKITALNDLPPFCYGTDPISRDTDGSIFADFQADLTAHEGQPLSMDDPWWYTALCNSVINKSIKKFETGICKSLDSQRTNALLLIIIMIIIQAGLISWLALSDIRPRRSY